MLDVCCGDTNEREKDGGVRGPVRLGAEGPRVMGAPTCAKCLSECSVFVRLIVNGSVNRSFVVRIVRESLEFSLIDPPFGRERVPFYR